MERFDLQERLEVFEILIKSRFDRYLKRMLLQAIIFAIAFNVQKLKDMFREIYLTHSRKSVELHFVRHVSGKMHYLHTKLLRQMRRHYWKSRPGDHLGRLRARISLLLSRSRVWSSRSGWRSHRFQSHGDAATRERRVINDRGVGG